LARTLFRNARLHRPAIDEGPQDGAWLLVEEGKLKKIGRGPEPTVDEVVDLEGQRVLPGLINAHTHLYSALAGRMPWPDKRPREFVEILRRIWWRLDRALDEDAVRTSARLGLYEALRRGCTTVIDHHSSPNFVEGSLALIAEEAEKLGMKIALACEVSDRDGEECLEDCMDENLRAMRGFEEHDSVRAVYGLHAGFTLTEESIEQALEVLPFDTPLHLHCAEALDDLEHARGLGYESVVDRLGALGALRPGTVLAHGVHLQPGDVELIREMGSFIVHCPQSNAHNRVGTADVGAMLGAGVKVGLGTDGFLTGMLAEAQFARDTGIAHGTLTPAKVGHLLFDGNPSIASTLFGRPVGWLTEGEDADFIVQERSGNVLDPSAKILRVVSRGRSVCELGRVAGVDAEALYAEAEQQAKRVWKRIADL